MAMEILIERRNITGMRWLDQLREVKATIIATDGTDEGYSPWGTGNTGSFDALQVSIDPDNPPKSNWNMSVEIERLGPGSDALCGTGEGLPNANGPDCIRGIVDRHANHHVHLYYDKVRIHITNFNQGGATAKATVYILVRPFKKL